MPDMLTPRGADVDEHRPARARHGVPWWVAIVWLIPVAALPALSSGSRSVVWYVATTGVVVALVVGLVQWRPRPATPWVLLVGAYACRWVGGALHVAPMTSGTSDGVVGDIAYLAYYPLALAAVVLLLRRYYHDRAAWLDALLWTVGAAVPLWLWRVEPMTSATLDARTVISMMLPAMDLLVLLLVVLAWFTVPQAPTWLRLMAIALTVQTITDCVYRPTTYAPGGWVDVGWLASSCLVAAAALHPSLAVAATRESPEEVGRLTGGRITVLLIPALAGPASVAVVLLSGGVPQTDDLAVATLSVVAVLLLAAARGVGLVGIANERADILQRRVDQDGLTGLASRDRFVRDLEDRLAQQGAGEPGRRAVVLVDLDDFHTVNDTQGQPAGDLLLVQVADRLSLACPADGLVARVGSDVFVLHLPAELVEEVATRLPVVLGEPVLLGHREHRLRVSVGSALARRGESVEELLRRAHIAVHAAKRSPVSWLPYQPGMSQALHRRTHRADQLHRALLDGQIVPWFQPVVDLLTGEVQGFEALARWVPPDSAPVAADEWLPLAEESDMIVSVDRVVLDAALRQLAHWRAEPGGHRLQLAVNLSGRTLACPGIDADVLEALTSAGVPGHALVVEVTEGIALDDDQVSRRLQRLRSVGIGIALDDFGTGWSSLSYLQRFPVDVLKLDRSFTAALGADPMSEAIPSAVAHLAASLGLETVAEGVETDDQRERLLGLGFRLAQGFLFAPALSPERVGEHAAGFGAVRSRVAGTSPAT